MEFIGVTQAIIRHLRHQIVLGTLAPGQKLNESQLSNEFAVSRAPLREALRVLHADGLVRSESRKGSHVTELTGSNLEELYQAREMVECHAIELLKCQSKRELPMVEKALKAAAEIGIPQSDDQKALLKFVTVFAGFHVKLVESAGNEIMSNFYVSLSRHLARYQLIYLCVPLTREKSLFSHKEVLSLIRKGKFDEAKQTLREHIRSTCKVLKTKVIETETEKLKISNNR
jgi:DNA-binding GntR family transcriptional regulator